MRRERVGNENVMSATPSSQAHLRPRNGGSVQIMAIVVVIRGQQRQIQEPVGCGFAAACAAEAEEWPSAEARRRLLKPTHELMSEGLPQPDI
jgi:hypothetical protein